VLPATCAVPAAMVVYELAYNAIVHGVGESGKLFVRVRKGQDEEITIEIVDDGASWSTSRRSTRPSPRRWSARGPQPNDHRVIGPRPSIAAAAWG
jgi:anti-sigma regulatory factor (Ser/Thr protein kinase)